MTSKYSQSSAVAAWTEILREYRAASDLEEVFSEPESPITVAQRAAAKTMFARFGINEIPSLEGIAEAGQTKEPSAECIDVIRGLSMASAQVKVTLSQCIRWVGHLLAPERFTHSGRAYALRTQGERNPSAGAVDVNGDSVAIAWMVRRVTVEKDQLEILLSTSRPEETGRRVVVVGWRENWLNSVKDMAVPFHTRESIALTPGDAIVLHEEQISPAATSVLLEIDQVPAGYRVQSFLANFRVPMLEDGTLVISVPLI